MKYKSQVTNWAKRSASYRRGKWVAKSEMFPTRCSNLEESRFSLRDVGEFGVINITRMSGKALT